MKVIIILFLILLTPSSCVKKDLNKLKADFSYEMLKGDSINFVRFYDKSKGEYLLSEWNFGDNSKVQNKLTVAKYYPFAGDFAVSLAVYGIETADTLTRTVSIKGSNLFIDFEVSVTDTNSNYVLLVKNSSELDNYFWTFNNRTIENENQVVAYFPFVGNYDISLTGSRHGVSHTVTKKANITQNDPNYLNFFQLVWSDEFDGTNVNLENWTFETGATGWGNNELQNYTNGENAEIVNGKLVITARKVNELKLPGSYTSSRMITRNKKTFTYGRMEIRARLPKGTGIWPAIWMLGNNIGTVGWPRCGEIDIMEYVGYIPNTVHATIHTESGYGGNGSGTSIPLASCEEEFHNYGIIWTERFIKFYIDDPSNITYTYQPLIKTESNWPFNKPAFFILNIAVGGNWGGVQGIDNSIFPQTMEIDYVRVFQPVN